MAADRLAVRYVDGAYSDSTFVCAVRRFQLEKMQAFLPLSPTIPDDETRTACIGLLYEESREAQKAILQGNIVETIDACADLIYSAVGVALLHGVDIGPILAEVHAANMEKGVAAGGFGRTTADGRSTKENWTPPRVRELLELQKLGRDVAPRTD